MSFDRLTVNVKRNWKKGGGSLMDNKKMGKRIRDARIARGFSQEDLGDAMSLTRSSVSLWEKGRSVPEEANLRSLAELLNVTPEYLTEGKGRAPVRKELPQSGYRRDMMSRMQRLIETGRFDDLIDKRMEQRIVSGELDGRLGKLGYTRKRR